LGKLAAEKNGTAHFIMDKGERIVATMERIRLEWAGAGGLYFSGMVDDGFTKTGVRKFRYQEWFLAYNAEKG
jgi:hypothetical protein